MLAHAPDDVQIRVLSNLERITPYTVTSPRVMTSQLTRARRECFAVTQEEMTLEACSVAVPVADANGEVVAALGVVVAFVRRDRPRLVAALSVAARGVTRSLSGR